ncbi:MAG: NAD(P)/FAD-dependent oxidoreductase [Oscillospiraceae bacterium]|nr:NAD(P)/FAD-dependent oxidoreductase [Oscillospiraceae bacterium]
MEHDVIVVGGGPAGCFAAVTAARLGRRVLLLEGNDRLGHKLSITGKGRCNVTNACDLDTLMANIPRNGRFLYSAFSNCMPSDVMEFFEQEGVPLKVERGRRVFPQSDRAADIVQALQRAMQAAGVEIIHARADGLCLENGCCIGVKCGSQCYYGESVLLATGGASYPRTGSCGDGYQLAKAAGHTIVKPQPSLVPIVTVEEYPAEMSGLSLKNVLLTVKQGEKICFAEQGEMLFTHFGISGPLVLSASAMMDPEQAKSYQVWIDMKPALSQEQLDVRILRDFGESPNRLLCNTLQKLLPSSMIPVVMRLAGLPDDLRVNSVTKAQRTRLLEVVKAMPLHCRSMRPIAEAIVTRGGVSVKEVSPKTMESKLCKGLFFAGELLDVDAYTGGYNLQIAFATGYAAGYSI